MEETHEQQIRFLFFSFLLEGKKRERKKVGERERKKKTLFFLQSERKDQLKEKEKSFFFFSLAQTRWRRRSNGICAPPSHRIRSCFLVREEEGGAVSPRSIFPTDVVAVAVVKFMAVDLSSRPVPLSSLFFFHLLTSPFFPHRVSSLFLPSVNVSKTNSEKIRRQTSRSETSRREGSRWSSSPTSRPEPPKTSDSSARASSARATVSPSATRVPASTG